MPRILIVEDSDFDRTLIEKLLATQEDIEDVELRIVGHGADALRALDEFAADVVVTDLVMPGMDGLELLAAIRRDHPLVPVVVVTSRGSEQTAVTALQRGAASYVPKHDLAARLVETLDRVLDAANRRRGRAKLMRVMVESHASFELDNDRALFRPLLNYLQDTMSEFGLFDEDDAMRVCVAIEEALNNAAEHGNLELDSSLRSDDFRGYVELMKRRCHEPPFRDRRVRFEAHFSAEQSVFVVADEGAGFDRSDLPDPRQHDRLAAVSGRGLTLMHAFMDEVEFNGKGNRVRLVKRRVSSPPQPA